MKLLILAIAECDFSHGLIILAIAEFGLDTYMYNILWHIYRIWQQG